MKMRGDDTNDRRKENEDEQQLCLLIDVTTTSYWQSTLDYACECDYPPHSKHSVILVTVTPLNYKKMFLWHPKTDAYIQLLRDQTEDRCR